MWTTKEDLYLISERVFWLYSSLEGASYQKPSRVFNAPILPVLESGNT
jgi:hypothetical protein